MTPSETTFRALGVPKKLVEALDRQGITSPFDIQTATIPDALAGKDVLGRAPTGSGKTLAFGIPMLARVGAGKPTKPTALILSPTRELAEQIRKELEPLARACDRSVLAIYGGVGFKGQLTSLKRGVDLVVACPGRLADLISQGAISLKNVEYVVVDEADRMADMGFLPSVRELLDQTASDRQTVLFSATLDNEVAQLTKHYQNNPVTHEVGETEPDLSSMSHRFITTTKDSKIALAADIIDDLGSTVVFCRTRHGADRVARQLKQQGVRSESIHGGRSQNQRKAALAAFTNGRVAALVATDVAARGIHVDGVECVIHFDPPADHKDYIHRSGRTARAGAQGAVVSFINPDQKKSTMRMQRDVGLPKIEIEKTPAVSARERKPISADHKKHPRSDRPARNSKSKRKPSSKSASSSKPDSRSNKKSANQRRSNSKNRAASAGPNNRNAGPKRSTRTRAKPVSKRG